MESTSPPGEGDPAGADEGSGNNTPLPPAVPMAPLRTTRAVQMRADLDEFAKSEAVQRLDPPVTAFLSDARACVAIFFSNPANLTARFGGAFAFAADTISAISSGIIVGCRQSLGHGRDEPTWSGRHRHGRDDRDGRGPSRLEQCRYSEGPRITPSLLMS